MRFALLGDHPDGLGMARALAETGRHELVAVYGFARGANTETYLAGFQSSPKKIADIEEILADPAVDLVVVAGRLVERPEQLRRALQSERHVACVHPADRSPDIAYEAALIQADTGKVLLPLMPEALHPAIGRLEEIVKAKDGPFGVLRLLEIEVRARGAILLEAQPDRSKPSVPSWNALRILGGEIAEVSAFAAAADMPHDQPLFLTGRFETNGLWQMKLIPGDAECRWRLAVVGSVGEAELLFPEGPAGPARLRWPDREETWPAWNAWPEMVEVLEGALGPAAAVPRPCWQDAIRCLELDDAARRSLERRRTFVMEYPEATEEVGFKGTMTLIGCGLLWIVLVLLVLSFWNDWLGWGIFPVLVVFLVLQLLRWIVPERREQKRSEKES